MKSKLNPRQAEVVKRVVKGQSQRQAYKAVYGVKDDIVADANASRLLSNDKVGNALQQALRRKGLDEDSVAETLDEMRKNRDWRAKESFIDRSTKFLGYDQGNTNLTQINIGGELGVQFEKV